ncbi:MAG: hypothetical protein ACJ746_20760 [Bryobacteraceae bacterium]
MSAVDVRLEKGWARLEARDVPILDYSTIGNALFAGGPAPVHGSVSFRVVWSGAGERVSIRNTDPVFGGFEGQFLRNSARMEWTGTVGDLRFESKPLRTSSSSFAEIGREQNGSYFSQRCGRCRTGAIRLRRQVVERLDTRLAIQQRSIVWLIPAPVEM